MHLLRYWPDAGVALSLWPPELSLWFKHPRRLIFHTFAFKLTKRPLSMFLANYLFGINNLGGWHFWYICVNTYQTQMLSSHSDLQNYLFGINNLGGWHLTHLLRYWPDAGVVLSLWPLNYIFWTNNLGGWHLIHLLRYWPDTGVVLSLWPPELSVYDGQPRRLIFDTLA
jgi:hypothetical protein